MNGPSARVRLRRLLLLVPVLWPWPPLHAATLGLAHEGRATAEIVLARDASPSETTAAEELALYLERVTSAPFEVRSEGSNASPGPQIHVGPTELARRQLGDPERFGPEEWVVRTIGDDLLLLGGRPRGTLYAVYSLLEKHVGVRWWSPFEEHVPRRTTLTLPQIDDRGAPAFVYRDIFGITGPRAFCARNRLNGHFTRLPWTFGGAEAYGPPKHVHNFFDYVPPSVYFDEHPEFFSELGGFRYADRSQLCLTNESLLTLVADRMGEYIERARTRAAEAGVPPPRLFDFSPNDWAGACDCEACRAVSSAAGSTAGPLVEFVGRLAEAVGRIHPDVMLDTLAYLHTFAAPRGLRLPDNVVVRLAALQQRDYTRPVTAPEHRGIRDAIEGWRRVTPHLRIWDYVVTYGDDGQLPLPNLRVLARDYRYYLAQGVEGMFVQHDFPIAADLRDLKQWVVIKLLEDPRRDVDVLIRQFTDGYYGAAGRRMRRYLRQMEHAARRDGSRVRFASTRDDYGYLTPRTITRAQRLFDRAERSVAGDAELLRRVRHARLSLDRATLLGAVEGLADRRVVAERYRQTWVEQIELRLPRDRWGAARLEVERELGDWAVDGP